MSSWTTARRVRDRPAPGRGRAAFAGERRDELRTPGEVEPRREEAAVVGDRRRLEEARLGACGAQTRRKQLLELDLVASGIALVPRSRVAGDELAQQAEKLVATPARRRDDLLFESRHECATRPTLRSAVTHPSLGTTPPSYSRIEEPYGPRAGAGRRGSAPPERADPASHSTSPSGAGRLRVIPRTLKADSSRPATISAACATHGRTADAQPRTFDQDPGHHARATSSGKRP